MVTMLMVRGVRPASRSGRSSAARCHRKLPELDNSTPPGAVAPGAGQRRQAGNRAHRVATTAHALHAVVHADGGRLAAACTRRNRVPATLICSTAMPHTAAARSGGHCSPRAQGVPAQRVVRQVVVVQPVVAISSCITARASAASVPGSRAMCSWHLSAVSTCAGRCRSVWRHCAWPPGRSARNAGCW
jgi:hypothetical protein